MVSGPYVMGSGCEGFLIRSAQSVSSCARVLGTSGFTYLHFGIERLSHSLLFLRIIIASPAY